MPLHDSSVISFASDNYSGIHPEILQAISDANGGHQISYGDDDYTEGLQQVIRAHCGEDAHTFPVFNGTGANVLSLQTVLPRWGAAICAQTAHVHCDEGGAPERVGGIKLLTVPTDDGKLTGELIDRQAWGFGDEHRAQPLAVSITQSTELGTAYQASEIAEICEHAHSLGMAVHLDGSRLANAAASTGASLAELTTKAGVDIFSLGGTKNGLLGAEAVVVTGTHPDSAAWIEALRYLRKSNMQLGSKMRFISAQLIALYGTDLYLRLAAHANAMAARLAAALELIPEVRITQKVQANGVFATLPRQAAERVRRSFRFYDWDAAAGEVRWMCSFDTTESDVDAFVTAISDALAS